MTTSHLILVIAITGLYESNTNSPINGTSYMFLKEENGVTLSSRNINLADSRTTRELRAEFMVTGNVETVLKVLKNDHQATRWMKGVKEFSIIRKENENNWYAYVQYEIPWPLSNQDCIIQYQCIAPEHGNGYILKMNSSSDYMPKKSDVERISHLCGCWTITENTNNSCKVVYTVYSEQKPKFPRWATDPIIQKNLINTLSSLKELAETSNK